MNTLIIGGGNIEYDFALRFVRESAFDYTIAADRGMEFLRRAGLTPDCIVGDFDSADARTLSYFEEKGMEIRRFRAEKDATDMEIAVQTAIEKGSGGITILGAFGTRFDHMLGSLKNLTLALEARIPCCMVDAHNRVRLADAPLTLKKSAQFGKYVSLLAFAEPVTGLTLEGFFYPLHGYTMMAGDAIGISNQIVKEQADITFDAGRLIVIESRD